MGKVISLEEASRIAAAARRDGKTVVFANGCFDLLHVGHARYLEGAKALGEVLIVGVNSDRSVRRLKGGTRPLLPEGSRAELVAAFRNVDYALIFDGETADEVLRRLKPHIHAKGTDYTEESVPERASVFSYGGKVAIAGDAKSHSTREILSRIRRAWAESWP
ncbi:MAG: adenylyltransferase/cytidyltransferase family protein [Acidobacteria bacterium]|nr:adenylyltransferase/cytidyltransferase family protein [Acidobacteriota bacterium]